MFLKLSAIFHLRKHGICTIFFCLLFAQTEAAAASVYLSVTCIKSEYTGMLALALRQLFTFCLLAGSTLSSTGFYRGCK